MSIKWHHFIDNIKQGTSDIVYIETNEQQYEFMTRPLAKPQFGFCAIISCDGEYIQELCSPLIWGSVNVQTIWGKITMHVQYLRY